MPHTELLLGKLTFNSIWLATIHQWVTNGVEFTRAQFHSWIFRIGADSFCALVKTLSRKESAILTLQSRVELPPHQEGGQSYLYLLRRYCLIALSVCSATTLGDTES